jgi:hypothetical protein
MAVYGSGKLTISCPSPVLTKKVSASFAELSKSIMKIIPLKKSID